ncbi:hypothetical protein BYT27DRAFT_7186615 [Phlegmacium glaucopus]|nr:hypothetical protein BYT27DRAFT_7186615 [Phlegmacium glaucopus]
MSDVDRSTHTHSLASSTNMADVLASFKAREKYRYFRILVIGRANAGKTTLLKRVCNTTDEPCIYDEKSNSLRGIHDIDRPFAFASNPQFIFHDSPGFETGDESQLKKVQSFIRERARSTEVDDQLHAIWFCFVPNKARFLLDLEKRFFNEERAGSVPVIAIFTKFDYLISQVYDTRLEEDENRKAADRVLKDTLRAPLFEYKFPPRADVCLEDMHDEDGDHQEQVKELIKKTAESLDDLALKILFVSLQQNNLELCVQYAVVYASDLEDLTDMMDLVKECLVWFRHSYVRENGKRIIDYYNTEAEHNDICRRYIEYVAVLTGNTKKVTMFMQKMFDKPSLTLFAALIICLENSFWYQSASVSFIDAFHKAFGIYVETAMEEKVEIALKELGDPSEKTAFQSALFKTLVEHCLCMLDYIFSTNGL